MQRRVWHCLWHVDRGVVQASRFCTAPRQLLPSLCFYNAVAAKQCCHCTSTCSSECLNLTTATCIEDVYGIRVSLCCSRGPFQQACWLVRLLRLLAMAAVALDTAATLWHWSRTQPFCYSSYSICREVGVCLTAVCFRSMHAV